MPIYKALQKIDLQNASNDTVYSFIQVVESIGFQYIMLKNYEQAEQHYTKAFQIYKNSQIAQIK